ncbi:hypothetical protein [Aquabacterium sp.]|uniref:hypothetical protein n=1 Tax=Aquabacterium sp. TaxID=1872578 RepID=UPI002486EE35|nr:hypothetical protein [Aquabacterium sp.]MDI1260151.1 hypothetical protein [Aquabacterium sp.]
MQMLPKVQNGKFALTRLIAVVLFIAVLASVALVRPSIGADQPQVWPTVQLPADAESIGISDRMLANGVPMRTSSFAAKGDVATAVAWFKARLGSPLTEDRLGNKTILGRPEGNYYITIQLEPIDTGVLGLIGVSDMRYALTQQSRSHDAKDAWIRDLPSGTKVLNLLVSQDDGKSSTYLLASNQQSDSLNAERATRALERRGFAVERRVNLEKGATVNGSVITVSGRAVLFKSADREATLMAFHDESGKAAVVINTVVLTGGRAP